MQEATTTRHNDDHQWNKHEDQAYHMYTKENHRKYSNFSNLKRMTSKPTGAGVTIIQTRF
jgi:hypothetical protein